MSDTFTEVRGPQSRLEVVEHLFQLWTDSRVSNSKKNIIGIVGHAGIGKTWIAREFYRRVRAEFESSWPNEFESAEAKEAQTPAKLLAERRIVAPSLDHLGLKSIRGAFAWIGISCDGTERYLNGTQMQIHLDSYESFYERLTSRRVVVTRFALVLTAVTGLISAFGQFFPDLLPTVLPLGIIAAILTIAGLFSVSRDFRELVTLRGKGSQRPGRVESSKQSDRLRLILRCWKQIVEREAALIVFVDDAHDADPELVKLLELGLQNIPEMFIIYTARWTGDAGRDINYQSFFNLIGNRPDIVEELSVDSLSEVESRQIVGNLKEGVNINLLQELVRHSGGNPLVLIASLASPSLRLFLSADTVDVEQLEAFVEILKSIPANAEQVLAEYWMELPEPLRELTSWAALQGLLVLEEALIATSTQMNQEVKLAISQLTIDYRWLSHVNEKSSLLRFVDAQLWRVSDKPPASHISPIEHRKAATRLHEFARHWLRNRLNGDETLSIESRILLAIIAQRVRDYVDETTDEDLRLALQFCTGGATDGHSQIVSDTLRAVIDRAHDLHSLQTEREAVRMLLQINNRQEIADASNTLADRLVNLAVVALDVNLTQISDVIQLNAVTIEESELLIESLVIQRKFDDALTCAKLAVWDPSDSQGSAEVLASHRIEFLAARAEAGLGRLSRAVELTENLIQRLKGPPDGLTAQYLDYARWRLMRIYWQLSIENSDAELDSLFSLVEEINRAWRKSCLRLSPRQFDLYLLFVRARQDCQAFLLRAGRVTDSLSYGELLLVEVESKLGRGHFEALTIRGGISHALTSLGRHKEAISNLRVLIKDRVFRYGPLHNMVFNSRRSLCKALLASGDLAGCFAEAFDLEAVMIEKYRNLDHPDLLRHQVALIRYLKLNHRIIEARERLRAVRPRVNALLAPSDPIRRELDRVCLEIDGS